MDCLEGLKLIPDNSIDLVVTSPPYPGASMWSNEGEDIQDNIKRLTKLSLDVLTECNRVIKEGGVIAWNLQDMPYGDHGIITTTTTTTIYAGQTLGLNLRGNIIWDKGVPHLPAPCFMRRPVVPNLTHEHILIFFKGDWIPREKTANMDARYKQWVAKGVWRIQTESAKGMNHIAPYPLKLAERCVALWSLEGDTVLDPFMGSGTTAVACKQLQRNFIGFELSQKYVDIANKRLQQDTLFSYDVLQTEATTQGD